VLLLGVVVAAVVLLAGIVIATGGDRVNPLSGEPPAAPFPASVPVGEALPVDDVCAGNVQQTGARETRPGNAEANSSVPTEVDIPPWGTGYDPRINRDVLARIDGRFTGTTDEILAWGACKWGFAPDIIRAMGMEESEWDQSLAGDVSDDPADCVPGDAPPCATSFGILQVKHLFRPGSYPASRDHTAFNVDYALAVVRACYEGYVTYLEPKGYEPGDLWGCLGWHYSGEWRDPQALGYIERVQKRLSERGWQRW
jgi:autotransporter family porin